MMPSVIDLSGSAKVRSFTSPAFETKPPELENAELLSPELRNLYSVLWGQSQPAEDVIVSAIPHATVEGPGLVFDQDLNLIKQSVHQATQAEIEQAYLSVRQHSEAGLLISEPGPTLLCEKAGIGNYGHWLIEMLPIVFLNLAPVLAGEWRVRLPVAGPAMNSVVRHSMDLLGVPESRASFRQGGPQRYAQLLMVHNLTHHGIRYSPLVIDAMDHLAASIPAGSAEKVWMSRATSSRRLVHEVETCKRLAEEGWLIVEPGTLSLREQISVARGARRIAGVNGAGLTNLVFAQPGAVITAFMPAQMPDVFFWMLAGFKKHRYREVRCRQASNNSGWDCPLVLSTDEVLAHLI